MTPTLRRGARPAVPQGTDVSTPFVDKPVSDDMLRKMYDLARMGPTSANSNPGRFVFLRSPEAKARLAPALSAGNLDKTMKRARHGDRRLRPRVPRAPAAPLLARRRAQLVRRQAGPHPDHRVSQQHAAGRVLHPGGARARPRLRSDVRLRQRQGRREFFPDGKLAVELPHQPRLRRPDEAPAAPSAPAFEEACRIV